MSKRYGTTVKWLQKVNHIKNPNKINTGQHLYVPKKKGDTRSNKNKIRVR
ncbi:LysM peptidoglycan-binding domain-containing protein [Lactobacillus crispatus]|nr:LysM peptidoglycan-binding domain-containing protein [Lactobacillus crispatus]WEB33821.1 LysM peptidoglycan-binding domain-containing protein [Lactobacillus crispatus]